MMILERLLIAVTGFLLALDNSLKDQVILTVTANHIPSKENTNDTPQ